ncbi:hypothetical protein G6F46_014834 [Rhizopus delemar]|nr:hypothetical protein G6F46_014834 [Rhizopus delemar]
MAQIVFRHFRVDPDVVDGDQRHHRVTGGGELTDIGAQVGDQARRSGAHLPWRCLPRCRPPVRAPAALPPAPLRPG